MTEQDRMGEPAAPDVKHCPFCDEDPLAEGHYMISKMQLLLRGRKIILQSLTCVHALPDDEKASTWAPWTFFVIEAVFPAMPDEDLAFLETLTDPLEEERPCGTR